ncbi:GNAT superfamily N-acetyltransferase [Catalinimonas alkaloidigena]|uniref:GNAT family N-acetyltransferase n=1 Tax=Catalinimonas alkaloidigena TaxID=1075417 RepID=UPI0024073D48|nr:GNAT family N-acetyltransferase [Catalinimonas alkaloidigena]MDF9795978.1 GNAT superfamily N-acetyltransferase [Catalinimonas alkaloidigena]
MPAQLSEDRNIPLPLIIELYRANDWSAADKPEALYQGLMHSHSLVTAWEGETLLGLGNAISDGHLVVYYPHLLVHPDYQGTGIGQMIMQRMAEKYRHFHMQMLTADKEAVRFYEKCGFVKAGATQPMWIYKGNEHD